MLSNHYNQISRIPGSSFYIRDILGSGNSNTYPEDQNKLNSYDSRNYYPSYSTSNLPASMMPYPQLGYPAQSFRGFSPDFLDPAANPVPLPVYIRSRSPSDIDGFSKPRRCRRSRTVFTELQLMGLEKKFENHKYLSTPDRIELAETLGLSQVQVKTWYQNRRMKWKKTVQHRPKTEESIIQKGVQRKEDQCGTQQHSYEPKQDAIDTQSKKGDNCADSSGNVSCQFDHTVNNNSDTQHVPNY